MQAPIYLVIETSGSDAEHDRAKLKAFLDKAYNDEIIANGTLASDTDQQASIWNLRESISEGLRHAGTPVHCSLLLLPSCEHSLLLMLVFDTVYCMV